MKRKGARILVVDGELEMLRLLQRILTAHDFQVLTMTSTHSCAARLKQTPIDLA